MTDTTDAVDTSVDEKVKVNLSAGGVKRLYDRGASLVPLPPLTLQVIEIRPLTVAAAATTATTAPPTRYRVWLSDGVHSLQSMLSSTLNDQVRGDQIKTLTVVNLQSSVTNTVGDRKILICTKMDILSHLSTRIGSPTDIELTPAIVDPLPLPVAKRKAPEGKVDGKEVVKYVGIVDLNVHLGKWAIKARVCKKSEMRTWSNSRGDGKFFTMELLDSEGGQIKATAFNAQAEKFWDIIIAKKVFTIRNGQIKHVDRSKPFNQGSKHNCDITFTQDTQCTEVPEDPTIQETRYDFVKIRDIHNYTTEDTIDLLGIVTELMPATEITSKKSGKPIPKQTIVVRDDTDMSIEVTLWGAAAKENELKVGDIVALKSLRVTDYGGKSLSMGFDGAVVLSPDRKEAVDLRKWWETVADQSVVPDCLTTKNQNGAERIVIEDIEDQHLGYGEKPDYKLIRVNVTQFTYNKERPPWYKSCPSIVKGKDGADRLCTKKIVEADSQLSCVSCGIVGNYVNRFMLTCQASDGTGSVSMSAFDDVASKLLGGHTADQLSALIEQDRANEVDEIFQINHLFKHWIMKCRIKAEPFKSGAINSASDMKQRIQIVSAEPLDFKKETDILQTYLFPPTTTTATTALPSQ